MFGGLACSPCSARADRRRPRRASSTPPRLYDFHGATAACGSTIQAAEGLALGSRRRNPARSSSVTRARQRWSGRTTVTSRDGARSSSSSSSGGGQLGRVTAGITPGSRRQVRRTDVYVVDSSNNRIQKFTTYEAFPAALGRTRYRPRPVQHAARDRHRPGVDNVYVTDYRERPGPESSTRAATSFPSGGFPGSGPGQLDNPAGVRGRSGQRRRVRADVGNTRIQKFTRRNRSSRDRMGDLGQRAGSAERCIRRRRRLGRQRVRGGHRQRPGPVVHLDGGRSSIPSVLRAPREVPVHEPDRCRGRRGRRSSYVLDRAANRYQRFVKRRRRWW